jgi:hypothetical protein
VSTTIKNLPKTYIKKSISLIKHRVGKPIQFGVATVGTRSIRVKALTKDISGNPYLLSNRIILKNKPYFTPVLIIKKVGTYRISIFLGKTEKKITIQVKK